MTIMKGEVTPYHVTEVSVLRFTVMLLGHTTVIHRAFGKQIFAGYLAVASVLGKRL